VGIPMQIIMRGEQIVQNFIQNLKRGKQKMYHASGMIIGCAGSGKTTLLKRLQGISIEEIKRTTQSTRGVDVFTDVFDVTTDTLQCMFYLFLYIQQNIITIVTSTHPTPPTKIFRNQMCSQFNLFIPTYRKIGGYSFWPVRLSVCLQKL
jgi:energy-coupling factor transporter ATP-binding protein EcfA2